MKKFLYWIGVFLVALSVRIVFFRYWDSLNYIEILGYDPYISVAEYWLGWHKPMVDVMLSPGYSFFLAGLFRAIGHSSVLIARLANIMISAITCVVAGWWAKTYLSPELKWPPVFFALWLALDPALITFSVQPQSETFFIFLEMLFFVALSKNWDKRWGHSFALGLLGGLTTMTRSVFAPYLPVFCGVLFLRDRSWRNVGLVFIMAFGWISPISIWTGRNYVKYHTIIPLSAQSGWNLYEGFTSDREEIRKRPLAMFAEIKKTGITDPIVASKYFQDKALRFIWAHPKQSLKTILGKGIRFWRPWPYDPYGLVARIVMGIYFSVLFALAFYGTRTRREQWRDDLPIYALLITLTLVHSVFFTSLRYRTPLEPFLCFFAMAGFL